MDKAKTTSLNKIYDMSVTRFLDCVQEESDAKQRFCFILGSGASYTSGIRTGVKLMEEWRAYLMEKGIPYIQECARAANYKWEECRHLFEGDVSVLKNADYFTLYDIRFVGCPTVGYSALEKEMEGTNPNVGYYYLASILDKTDHRLVITTNFDSLTEDALFYYSGHHPLVLGHEKLAPYVASVDRKPVVAKIHRDLLMDPMNHLEEMEKLQEDWRGPLSAALSRYVPIVIGYAGGDKTLMSLLAQLKLKSIFWCTLDKEGEEGLPELAREIIRKNHGHWVRIQGFDELMYRMAARMKHLPDLDKMRSEMDMRHHKFQTKHEELINKYSPSRMKETAPDTAQEDAGMLQAVLQEESSKDPSLKDYNQLLDQALVAWKTGDFEQALAYVTNAIMAEPDRSKGYDFRSTLHHKMGNYDQALADTEKAIKLDPENPEYHYSRAVTLHEMGRYAEALTGKTKAIELDPQNALYHEQRGVTLRAMDRCAEALKEKTKAIELDPQNAAYYHSRSATLHAMGRYEEALQDSDKAIEFDPQNSKYHHARAITLHVMERYEEALQDSDKAIELDPQNAAYYYSRGVTLHAMGRYEEALQDWDKAIELDPQNAAYYYSRSITLWALERNNDALSDLEQAVVLEPENAVFWRERGVVLEKLERYEKAAESVAKADELEKK